MAFKVIWSLSASDDLMQIVRFIANDNRKAAAMLAEQILQRAETAGAMPWAGRVVPEKEDASIRELILRPYRIIYLVDEPRDAVHILRIWHAARGLPEIGEA